LHKNQPGAWEDDPQQTDPKWLHSDHEKKQEDLVKIVLRNGNKLLFRVTDVRYAKQVRSSMQ